MKTTLNLNLIENFLKENKMSKSEFSKKCKIALSTLNRVLNGCENFSLVTVFKIARALQIKISDIFT